MLLKYRVGEFNNMGLSPKEREGLLHRPSNAHERATNDVRVRKKLAAWLKNLPDMALVFRYLPEEQLRKELFEEWYAYDFLGIAITIMDCLGFSPIIGEFERPEEWQVVIDENNQRPVENLDILRSLITADNITPLKWISDGPVSKFRFLLQMDEDPEFHDRVTDDERRGIKRVVEALRYFDTLGNQESNSEPK